MHFRSIVAVTSALLLSSTSLLATSSGITGRALTTGQGCSGGGCHGSKNVTTTVMINEAVNGIVTVTKNQRVTLTLVVAHPNRVAVGMNIAVKRTLNGNARIGIFDVNGDQGMRISPSVVGELTHSTPKVMTDGAAEFSFGWTSPDEEGEFFLHAVANAVDRNGSATSNDNWNFLTPIKIVVSGTNSVSEVFASRGSLTISPVPAHGSVAISAPVTPGESLTIQITDAVGNVIRRFASSSNEANLLYVWDGRTDSGSEAAPGTYVIAVIGDRRITSGRAIIVR